MPKTSATHGEHRDDEQHERHEAEVASSRHALLAPPKMRGRPALTQEAPEQLQTGVRRQPLLPEFDPQVTLDSSAETAFSYPHWKWPFSSEIFELRNPKRSQRADHFQIFQPLTLERNVPSGLIARLKFVSYHAGEISRVHNWDDQRICQVLPARCGRYLLIPAVSVRQLVCIDASPKRFAYQSTTESLHLADYDSDIVPV
jgi:hypothetical protein